MIRDRLRHWWQCVIVAGAVSYSQLQPMSDFEPRSLDRHAFVWVLPSDALSRADIENVGDQVTTLPYEGMPTIHPN